MENPAKGYRALQIGKRFFRKVTVSTKKLVNKEEKVRQD